MYPVELRFGIGIGKISTEIFHEVAIGADGPAYYAARLTIEELREQEKRLRKQVADIQISIYNIKCFEITEINMMLLFMKIIKSDNKAGRKIGTIERMIMLIFLSRNQFAALGFVLTAKSIARYDKITKDEKFAEYYLLGTLVSTLCVIIGRMLILE